MTWTSPAPPPRIRPGAPGLLLAAIRGVAIGGWFAGMLAILLLARSVERPLCGLRRPVTPRIAAAACRVALALAGLRLRVEGPAFQGHGAIVANHSSWLDILALNGVAPVFFVSKAEVARWPGIGLLARAAGTVFIARERREAGRQTALFRERLSAGHRLLFFPEGTSTDGLRVLTFKPTLFQAFLDPGLRESVSVQPVSVVYRAPPGADPRFYGWWGDMDLAPHLVAVLSSWRRGHVTVVRHPAIRVADCADRKALALACEGRVRAGLERGEQLAQPR